MVTGKIKIAILFCLFLCMSTGLSFAGQDIFYIDRDGDGYGVGDVYVEGADADDADFEVNTPATVELKYGSIQEFLKHKGYNSERIFFISVAGNDETGVVNSIENPFATWKKIEKTIFPGDVVIFRAGTYHQQIKLKNFFGLANKPIIFMSYPGESVLFDNCGTKGNSACFSLKGAGNLIIDGFVFDNSANNSSGNGVYVNGTSKYDWGSVNDIIIKNVLVRNAKSGIRGMVNLHNVLVENSVIHNTLSHGIYFGTADNKQPNSKIKISNCILYNVAKKYDGRFCIQHNGIIDGFIVEKNVCHSNYTGGGLSLVNGAKNSIIRNNLIFNNAKNGIVLYGYKSKHSFGGKFINNEIINNTIWVGKYDFSGKKKPLYHPGILLNDATGEMDILYTNIRNNIIFVQSGSPIVVVQDKFLPVTIVKDNIFYCSSDHNVFSIAKKEYNLSSIEEDYDLIGRNLYINPKFINVSLEYYNKPSMFDFRLSKKSPAVNFCSKVRGFDVQDDIAGALRTDGKIDAGCYEFDFADIDFLPEVSAKVVPSPPITATPEIEGSPVKEAASVSKLIANPETVPVRGAIVIVIVGALVILSLGWILLRLYLLNRK